MLPYEKPELAQSVRVHRLHDLRSRAGVLLDSDRHRRRRRADPRSGRRRRLALDRKHRAYGRHGRRGGVRLPGHAQCAGPDAALTRPRPRRPQSVPVPAVETAQKLNALADEAPRSARRTELDNAIDQSGGRVGQWISDQQKRLSVGLDLLLAQLDEHREEELARMRAWEASERTRVETELATEQDHFHDRLMGGLKAFEEQLALRLAEHEERLARRLAEVGQHAEQSFAAHRAAGSSEGGRPTV